MEQGDPGDLGLDGLLEGEEVQEAAEGDGGGEVGGEGGNVGEGGRGESGLVEGGGTSAPVGEGAHAGGVGEPRGVVVCGEEGDLVLGELSVKANHQRRGLASMEEPARGMERTSTFAGMWRPEASRRGGCWESRAMDRRGQASAAVNCSRWRSGDRAENGCAMVPVGSGAREGLTHGVPGGGRSVDGCGRQSWCVMRVGGVGRGGWAGGRKGEAEASAQGPEAPACRAVGATLAKRAPLTTEGGGGGCRLLSGGGGGARRCERDHLPV